MLRSKLFKRKSEKIASGQLSLLTDLFNEIEVIVDENKDEEIPEDLEILPRKKSGKNKNHIRYGLVEKETIQEHLLSEEEQVCSVCGDKLRMITSQIAYTELVYHRDYYERIIHKQGVYECVNKCAPNNEGPHGDSIIVKAPVSSPLLPKCCASPSLIASIACDKFEKSLPLYRQETAFEEIGIKLTRQTMSNWMIKLYDMYLNRIMEYMWKEIKKSHLLLIDETRVEVLNHSTHSPSSANSYIWVAIMCYRT